MGRNNVPSLIIQQVDVMKLEEQITGIKAWVGKKIESEKQKQDRQKQLEKYRKQKELRKQKEVKDRKLK